jgi:L-rhamnose mutarotase
MMDCVITVYSIFWIIAVLIICSMWIATAISEEIKSKEETKRWTKMMDAKCKRALKSIDEMVREMEKDG